MEFARPLVRGRLVARYKRFLADVILDEAPGECCGEGSGGRSGGGRGEGAGGGRLVTAHCPNPGAMTGLAAPGSVVWLEPSDAPRCKLGFGWRLVELAGGHLAGIDTGVPNRVVGAALRAGRVPALAAYGDIRPEVRYGARSRIDFLARGAGLPDAYVEVKNVHLSRAGGWAEFPDCVTARGARHLREMAAMVAAGHRAVTIYLVQRSDCGRFRLAADIDPGYAAAAAAARAAGVEALAFAAQISRRGVALGEPLPISPFEMPA